MAPAVRKSSALTEEPSKVTAKQTQGGVGLEQKSLVECRKEAGLTQDDMARALGVTRSRYAQIERDPSNITIRQARKICSILGQAYETIIFNKFVS